MVCSRLHGCDASSERHDDIRTIGDQRVDAPASSRRASSSVSTVQTWTPSRRGARRDEARRHDARAARDTPAPDSRRRRRAHRPAAPRSVERPAHFLARRAGGDRRLERARRRAARAARTIRGRRDRRRPRARTTSTAAARQLRAVHLQLDDDARVAIARQHLGERRARRRRSKLVRRSRSRDRARADVVVRSSVRSWCTTTTPSRDRWTSSSRPSAPSARPLSNAAIVFSGASALPPRCANTSGRRDVEERMAHDASVCSLSFG